MAAAAAGQDLSGTNKTVLLLLRLFLSRLLWFLLLLVLIALVFVLVCVHVCRKRTHVLACLFFFGGGVHGLLGVYAGLLQAAGQGQGSWG